MPCQASPNRTSARYSTFGFFPPLGGGEPITGGSDGFVVAPGLGRCNGSGSSIIAWTALSVREAATCVEPRKPTVPVNATRIDTAATAGYPVLTFILLD